MFCPHCGCPLPEGSRFCPNCGTEVPDVASSAQSASGAAGSGNARSDSTAAQPAVQPSATQPAQPSPPQQPAPGSGSGNDSRNLSRRQFAIGATVSAAAVIAVGAAVAWSRRGNGTSSSTGGSSTDDGSNGSSTGSATVGGLQVAGLARPSLVTLPQDDTTLPAPALVGYRDGSSGGSAQASSGAGASDSGSSDASTSGSDSSDADGGNSTPFDPSSAVNADAFGSFDSPAYGSGLLPCLKQNGFAIEADPWGFDEFYELYEDNRYNLRANFVTVDSLMHTYHLYFQHLLKSTEKSMLSDRISSMSEALLAESLSHLDALTGSEWETAAQREVAFFAVGLRLMGGEASVPSSLESTVAAEVSAIEAAGGTGTSPVTGAMEDYTQYKPRGYYEGDDQLERYFRTMMWYGRTNFTQQDEDLDRCACLVALAVHDAAVEDWEAVYAITSFFAGASDDSGYCEYYPLVEAAFGEGVKAEDLAGNTDGWQSFHNATASLEPPKINSVVYVKTTTSEGQTDTGDSTELDDQKGFRLMGQRFSVDEAIFEQLLPDAIGKNSVGEDRVLPSGLDVTAALGSDTALSILGDEGATGFSGYSDNMDALRKALANADDDLWTASLYSQWLYTLNPLLAGHDDSYPAFMRSSAWDRRNLQVYLGSYTELKHDTMLYAKQVMAEMGGGGVDDYDDRGYVEPEAELYRRMGNLVRCTSTGLAGYDALGQDDSSNLDILASLADQLAAIADAELAGDSLTSDQYELIRSYGGQLEHFWTEVYKGESDSGYVTAREFPAAVVTDVASNATSGTCLELGTGSISTIYVLFELEGALHIASGGSYRYYEFEQPMSDRLTDTEWRQMMGIQADSSMGYASSPAVEQPDWVDGFSFSYE